MQKQTSLIFKNCRLLFSLIFIGLSGNMYAQPNFLPIFNSATPCNVVISANATPSAALTTGLPKWYYDISILGSYENFWGNAAYDNLGNLLFSVNPDGIFDASGTQEYGFFYPSGSAPCGSYNPGIVSALSEIYIVPIPCKPNSYYVLCWGGDGFTAVGSATASFVLTAIEVDIDPTTTPFTYTFTTNYIPNSLDPTGNGCSLFSFHDGIGVYAGLVVDNQNADGSRYFYTVTPDPTTGETSNITQWKIDNTGALPTYGTVLSTAGTLGSPASNKVKIFSIPNAGAIQKCIAYTTRNSNFFGNSMQTFNLSTADIENYVVPTYL